MTSVAVADAGIAPVAWPSRDIYPRDAELAPIGNERGQVGAGRGPAAVVRAADVAHAVDGRPFPLVEMLHGLRHEDRIRVVDGRATLVGRGLPDRVRSGTQEAEVRLRIAGMVAVSPEIRVNAGRLALALPDLPDDLRARHLACLFLNQVTSGRLDLARVTRDEACAAVVATGDVRAAFTLRVAESAIEYADDRFGASLDLIEAANRDGSGAGDDQRLPSTQMWYSEVLSALDRHDEAFAIVTDGLDAARHERRGWAYQMFEAGRGRMLLRTGRLCGAAEAFDARVLLDDTSRPATVLDAAAMVGLGRLSLHVGDTRQVRRLGDQARAMLEQGTLAVQRHAGWLLAVIAMAEGDPAAAVAWLRTPAALGSHSILPRFPLETTDEVELARIAMAAQDEQFALLALTNAQQRAQHNPGVASIAATAAHVRGLLTADRAELRLAVELFGSGPHRLAYGSALEDLGTHLAATDREAGIDALVRALAAYTHIGATWDTRRVRSRLGALGVRRRIIGTGPRTKIRPPMPGTSSRIESARPGGDHGSRPLLDV